MIKLLNKTYLVLLMLIFSIDATSQTPFWEEDFMEAQAWTAEGNWVVNTGYMRFSWDPIMTNFDMSATSPVITLEDRDYGLSVTQYLEPWMESVTTEKAEISIISDGNEFVLWTYDLSNGYWGAVNGTAIDFDISAYAGTDIQIRFRTYGPTTDAWFWWDVFSLSIITFLDNDMAVNEITGPINLEINEGGTWSIEIKNVGLDYQKDFMVRLFDFNTGELIGSVTEEDSLGFGQTKIYDFNWSYDSSYNTVLRAVVEHDGDEYLANNVSDGAFVRIKPDREIKIAVWENDNAIPTIVDPEIGDVVRPPIGVKRALRSAGFTYDSLYLLPDSLAGYDVILAIMGCYCLS